MRCLLHRTALVCLTGMGTSLAYAGDYQGFEETSVGAFPTGWSSVLGGVTQEVSADGLCLNNALTLTAGAFSASEVSRTIPLQGDA